MRIAIGVVAALLAWTLGSYAEGQYVGIIPRHCGMRPGLETYGPLVAGTVVVLGMHTP